MGIFSMPVGYFCVSFEEMHLAYLSVYHGLFGGIVDIYVSERSLCLFPYEVLYPPVLFLF